MLRYVIAGAVLLFSIAMPVQGETVQKKSNPAPPITIGGFAANYVSQGRIYMNVCRQPSCVPGSKVSYQFHPPEAKPNFKEFARLQKRVASHFKAQAPKGTKLKFGSPAQTRDDLFTIFTNYREMHLANGTKHFTKSMMIYGDKITISLISSSQQKMIAETNSNLFQLALMAWSEALKANN